MDPASRPGFFGKVPSQGDFVHRHLPRRFLDPWDIWLQGAIRCSQQQHPEGWLDIYLTSPLWRFVLSRGVCGETPWIGLLMPSVDRVGRYFPFTVACPLPKDGNPLEIFGASEMWYQAVERLALSALEDGFDLEQFDQQLESLGTPFVDPPLGLLPIPPTNAAGEGRNAWRLTLDALEQLPARLPGLTDVVLRELFFAFSLWWSQGSDRVRASLLLCQGLPPLEGFSALLAGDWEARGWRESDPEAAEASSAGPP